MKGLVTFDAATAAVNSDEKAESAIAWDMGNRLESYELKLMHLARASKKDCRSGKFESTEAMSKKLIV
ncbi:unnamed protein product [Anisakis simplex]|uniref:Uncharacterized protein n=1 Tax=Anisakis simplex TaxID=6269 RepID=A0A3P6QAV1_ANISI|nr:unnamed protein product [Anisakis simplex]